MLSLLVHNLNCKKIYLGMKPKTYCTVLMICGYMLLDTSSSQAHASRDHLFGVFFSFFLKKNGICASSEESAMAVCIVLVYDCFQALCALLTALQVVHVDREAIQPCYSCRLISSYRVIDTPDSIKPHRNIQSVHTTQTILFKITCKQEESARERALCQLTECF